VIKCKSWAADCSSAVSSTTRAGRPFCTASSNFFSASASALILESLVFLTAFQPWASASPGFQIGQQQFGIDDVDVVQRFTPPATWITFGSSNSEPHDKWRRSSGCGRETGSQPSPLLAPSTRPAMSMNSIVVGTRL